MNPLLLKEAGDLAEVLLALTALAFVLAQILSV